MKNLYPFPYPNLHPNATKIQEVCRLIDVTLFPQLVDATPPPSAIPMTLLQSITLLMPHVSPRSTHFCSHAPCHREATMPFSGATPTGCRRGAVPDPLLARERPYGPTIKKPRSRHAWSEDREQEGNEEVRIDSYSHERDL